MKTLFLSIENIVSGVITGLINGAIAFSHMKAGDVIAITVDQISTIEKTVFSQSVMTAFILGIVSTLITSRVFAQKVVQSNPAFATLVNRPIFPDVAKMAISNAVFMFGALVIVAILWQRFGGVVVVDRLTGACLMGFIAALITMLVSYRTEKSLLQ